MPNAKWEIEPGETLAWDCRDRLKALTIELGQLLADHHSLATQARGHQHGELADKLEELADALASHLGELASLTTDAPAACGRDAVTESSMESFPASDPPAHY